MGGLLNKCRINSHTPPFEGPWWMSGIEVLELFSIMLINSHTVRNIKKDEITSKPYELCFCKPNSSLSFKPCNKHWNVTIFSGQTLNTSVWAAAQIGTTSTSVNAITSLTARLEPFQTTQFIGNVCHILQYTVYSSANYEEIKLYADGPCRDVGDANVITLHTYIQPCPHGFIIG